MPHIYHSIFFFIAFHHFQFILAILSNRCFFFSFRSAFFPLEINTSKSSLYADWNKIRCIPHTVQCAIKFKQFFNKYLYMMKEENLQWTETCWKKRIPWHIINSELVLPIANVCFAFVIISSLHPWKHNEIQFVQTYGIVWLVDFGLFMRFINHRIINSLRSIRQNQSHQWHAHHYYYYYIVITCAAIKLHLCVCVCVWMDAVQNWISQWSEQHKKGKIVEFCTSFGCQVRCHRYSSSRLYFCNWSRHNVSAIIQRHHYYWFRFMSTLSHLIINYENESFITLKPNGPIFDYTMRSKNCSFVRIWFGDVPGANTRILQ